MKKKIFIILSVVIVAMIFTTAQICNQCGVQPTSETQQEQKQESTKQQSNQTSGTSQDTAGTSKESTDTKSSNSSSGGKIEITDIIVGDVIDEHVEPADLLFTDSTYTCYPVMVIPPDGTETYSWSVSGGSNDNGAFYMQWETPSDEGTYTINLDITKDDGSSGAFSKDVFIEFLYAVDEPPLTPTIIDIEISGSDDGNYYANTIYTFNVATTEPFDMIDQYIINVTSGTVLSHLGGIMEWESPDVATDCTITADILDIDGNIMDSKSKVITILNQ